MTQSAQDILRRALLTRKENGTFRSLHKMQGIDFSSNDYLGLARLSMDVNETISGATGSRLISGHDEPLSVLEGDIAKFHGFDDALLFSSGYAANTGLLACLGTQDDVIISDELIHASLIDGIRLSYAKRARFKHNDLADLDL
ncbi:MAG: aminotransferase class I/II-fold pyridoxal phosphate-dependent enzyme, partial [Litorimonas sp.]